MGWDDRKRVDLPDWTLNLRGFYFVIRVEGRNPAKRRQYYRKVEAEKLRLAECGIDQKKIAAVCRYLSNFRNAETVRSALAEVELQLVFTFSVN